MSYFPGPMEHLLAFASVLSTGLLIGVVLGWLLSRRVERWAHV